MLEMQFKYSFNRIFIQISDYISSIYNKYAPILSMLADFWPSMAVNTRLSKTVCLVYTTEKEYISKVPYMEVVGVFSHMSSILVLRCESRG